MKKQKEVKNVVNKKTQNKKRLGKKKIIILSSVAALLVTVITVIAVGLTLYFNSPAYTASRLYQTIKNKDGEAFEELIIPSEREYLNSLVSPFNMTLKDIPDFLGSEFQNVMADISFDFDVKYTKKENTAKYTVTFKEDDKLPNFDLTFKNENGKWYFAPAALTEAMPIKAGLGLLEAVTYEDGKKFLDCVDPSQAAWIRSGLKTIGKSEADLFKALSNQDIFSLEEGEIPTVKNVKYEPDEKPKLTIDLQISDSETLSLVFVNEDGKWYLSLSNHLVDFIKDFIADFFKNFIGDDLKLPDLWDTLFPNWSKK